MATLSGLLAQIRQRESSNNYGLPPEANYDYPNSHASGAYQFQPATWRQWTQASGIGGQYSQAYLAPPGVQDAVAAYAATHGNPNSTALWGASARNNPYPQVTQIDVTPQQLAANDNSGGASLDFSVSPTSPNQLGGSGDGQQDFGGGDPTANPAGLSPYDPFGLGQQGGAESGNLPGSPLNPAPGQGGGTGSGLPAIGAWISNWGVRFALIALGVVLIAAAAWALAQGELKQPAVIKMAAGALK